MTSSRNMSVPSATGELITGGGGGGVSWASKKRLMATVRPEMLTSMITTLTALMNATMYNHNNRGLEKNGCGKLTIVL